MQIINVEEVKTHFPEVSGKVLFAEEVSIISEENKDLVTKIVTVKSGSKKRRKLGRWQGPVIFSDNFKMTVEEFLAS